MFEQLFDFRSGEHVAVVAVLTRARRLVLHVAQHTAQLLRAEGDQTVAESLFGAATVEVTQQLLKALCAHIGLDHVQQLFEALRLVQEQHTRGTQCAQSLAISIDHVLRAGTRRIGLRHCLDQHSSAAHQ